MQLSATASKRSEMTSIEELHKKWLKERPGYAKAYTACRSPALSPSA
jgi:hypothetical protein